MRQYRKKSGTSGLVLWLNGTFELAVLGRKEGSIFYVWKGEFTELSLTEAWTVTECISGQKYSLAFLWKGLYFSTLVPLGLAI